MGIEALQPLLDALPDAARDLKLNITTLLGESALSPQQRWATAAASAYASRNDKLRDAVLAGAKGEADDAALDDARAAAALMGMNNVFYRFKHFMGEGPYEKKPARLRMNRIARTAGPKIDFELYCLAVSAINGCESCVRSHEDAVRKGGLTEDHVWDAVRIAAVIHALAVALEG